MIDADGTVLGKYRKHHIPQVKGFWEKYYFKPGNLGWPVFDTAVGKVGVYICYDRHFPEGWRALGLAGAADRLQPLGHQPRASRRTCGSWSSPPRPSPTSTSSPRSTGSGVEEYGDNDFYGTSYFVDPRGQFVGEVASGHDEELVVRDLDFGLIDEVRQQWAFYRDRRPDAYGGLVEAVSDSLDRTRAVLPDWLALYYEEPIEITHGEGRHVWDAEGHATSTSSAASSPR